MMHSDIPVIIVSGIHLPIALIPIDIVSIH